VPHRDRTHHSLDVGFFSRAPTLEATGEAWMGDLYGGSCPHSPLLEDVFGWLGCVAAWVLFLAPIEVMMKVSRRGFIEGFSVIPYVTSAISTGLWDVYALPQVTPCKLQPLVTNVVGMALQIFYISFFIAYAGVRRASVLGLTFAGIACFTTLCLVGLVLAPHLEFSPPVDADGTMQSKQTFIIGIFTAIFNILMYASPLTVMWDVVRTQSVEYMPLGLTIGVGVCAGCWIVYGALADDRYILIPNITGIVLCAFQLALYVTYMKKGQGSDQLLSKGQKGPAASASYGTAAL